MDVISFCSNLVKRKSVTPNDDGAIEYIAKFLSSLGFETQILVFQSADKSNVIRNLFAKYGNSQKKVLGFLGHSDVVPAGEGWSVTPFDAVQKDGFLMGRGVADMKGGISAFCCAVSQFVKNPFDGTIEFFITGDEEIGSFEGIQSLIKWAAENDNIPHDCLIGEPSSNINLGDRVYLGHRGSMNVVVKSHGRQGHVAYDSENSLTALCKYIAAMSAYPWKYENTKFPKTKIEPTMLFTNNYAVNVVPDESSANINIRFSTDYTSEDLKRIFLKEAEQYKIDLGFKVSGEAYYSDSKLKNILADSIKEITGETPAFSAAGGTSDGRYMINYCDIIEFGMQDSTIHQKDERIRTSDLQTLEKIYLSFLNRYFE